MRNYQIVVMYSLRISYQDLNTEADPGGGGRVLGVSMCVRKRCGLVLNSYPDAPPPFPKSCIRPSKYTLN